MSGKSFDVHYASSSYSATVCVVKCKGIETFKSTGDVFLSE